MDYNITQKVMHDTLRLDEVVEFAENPEPRCPCVLITRYIWLNARRADRSFKSRFAEFEG